MWAAVRDLDISQGHWGAKESCHYTYRYPVWAELSEETVKPQQRGPSDRDTKVPEPVPSPLLRPSSVSLEVTWAL